MRDTANIRGSNERKYLTFAQVSFMPVVLSPSASAVGRCPLYKALGLLHGQLERLKSLDMAR
jgi:hypothetical protein